MRKNKRLLLSLLTINALTLSYGKLKGEVSFGVSSNFGVDNLHKVTSLVKPSLNLLLAKQVLDYEQQNSGGGGGGGGGGGSVPQYEYYLPPYPKNIDLELAARYLTQAIRFKKTLKVKLEDDYTGLGVGLDLIGKNSDYTNFIENKEIDKLKLRLSSNNKYVQGEINYYVIGEQQDNNGIEKIDEDNGQIANKTVDYNINITPLVDFPMQASFNIQGQGKNAELSPTASFTHNGFYVSMSPTFEVNRKDVDISEEISKIAYAAPGYDRIEYFKKWTKKDPTSYDEDQVDLLNATATGHKGTWRLLGLPSGSLYGDSPTKLILNEVLNGIQNNPKLSNIAEALKDLERGVGYLDIPGLALKYAQKYKDIQRELQDREAINPMLVSITNRLLRRFELGGKTSKYTSSLDIYKQVPPEFRSLIPGLTPDYDLYNMNTNLFDINYLYYNGLKRPEGVASNTATPTQATPPKYELKKDWHYLGSDVNKYMLPDIEKYYGFQYLISKLQNPGLGLLGEIGKIKEKVDRITDLLRNPYEMKSIDMLRGIYFHASEKDKNIMKLEEKLEPLKKEIENVSDKKQFNNVSLKLSAGHVGKHHRIDLYSKLNDITTVTGTDLKFVKGQHIVGLNIEGAKNGFIGKTNIQTTYSNIDFAYKKTNINYSTTDILMNTYLGYRIKAGRNWAVDLGITHHGEFGHINPITFTENGKTFTMKVAKRDENGNPIDLDGNVLDISKQTEKGLVDYAYNKSDKKKSKRHFNSSDALQKEDKELTSYWYNIYNILMPTLGVSYMPHRNLEIYNQVQIPLAFSRSKFSGVNLKYKGELRYLIGDSDFDIFKNPKQLFSIGTHGKIGAGLELSDNKGFKLDYDMQADLSALKLSLRGQNKDLQYVASLNPIVVDFAIKPRVIFSKETDKFMKFGLELSTKTNGNIVAGVQKVVSKDDKIFSDKLVPQVEQVLKDRNVGKEVEKFTEKIAKFKFDSPLEYTYTPFVEYELYTKDLKVRLGLSSKYGEKSLDPVIEKRESDYKIKDQDLKDLGDYKNSDAYITYAKNKNAGWFSDPDPWVYFVPINKYSDVKEIQSIKKLTDKKYKVYFNVDYEKEYGFNAKADVNFEYDNIKFTETTKVLKHYEKIKRYIYALKFHRGDKYIDDKIKNQILDDKNIVDFDKNATQQEKYDKIKQMIQERDGKDLYNSDKNKIITEVEKENPKPNVLNDKSSTTNTIGIRNMNFNTNVRLGYTFKVKDDFFVGIALNHKLDLQYLTIDNVILDDLKLFGSSTLKVKNELAPEINAKYKVLNGLNWNTSIKVPVQFENKKYTNTSINFKTGLEFKW